MEGYFAALAPLVAPILMIPLSDSSELPKWARELYRATTARVIDRAMLRKHFTFSEVALKQGRWWTAVTYMFHHQNAKHLGGNLFSLCWFGRPVYYHFGAVGLYSVFLSGGVLAAIDLHSKNWQLSEWIGNAIPVPQSWSISPWLNKKTRSLSKWVAPYLADYVDYKGASAGVFAVLGTAACVKVEQLLTVLFHWKEFDLNTFLFLGLDCSLLCMRIIEEYDMLANGKQFGVDHAGHVDGAVCGVAAYLIFSVAKWAYRRFRWRRIGQGRTVGRR